MRAAPAACAPTPVEHAGRDLLRVRYAVDSGREALRNEFCSEHIVPMARFSARARLLVARARLQRANRNEHRQTVWHDQWAGELLTKLAEGRKTVEAIRVMVAWAPVDCRGVRNNTALIWAVYRGDIELV